MRVGRCMSALKRVAVVLVLIVAFVGLFSISGQLVMPPELMASTPPGSELKAVLGLLFMAAVDVAFIVGVVLTSRLRGPRLWFLVSAVYWGTKSFTGQLEAWYFMPNVDAALVPRLLLLTVPIAIVVPLLAVALLGRWSGVEEFHAVRVPHMGALQLTWKWVLLSAVVYPVLFFLAGYYIAFSNDVVRAFYGGEAGATFAGHMRALLSSDPAVWALETFRGALWVAMGCAVLWTTRGKTWSGAGWVLLLFTLVQNDVHFIPNPLMPPTVQLFHFVETVSSNAIFAMLIVALMHRAHVLVPPAHPPRLSHA